MITEKAQRIMIIKRMRQTRRGETLCLWGWETEVILKLIDEQREQIETLTRYAKADGIDADALFRKGD